MNCVTCNHAHGTEFEYIHATCKQCGKVQRKMGIYVRDVATDEGYFHVAKPIDIWACSCGHSTKEEVLYKCRALGVIAECVQLPQKLQMT